MTRTCLSATRSSIPGLSFHSDRCCVAVGVHGAGPSAPGSNPVETSAIFPGSDAIGLASPAKELGVARATVQYLDAWTQQNAFPQVRFENI